MDSSGTFSAFYWQTSGKLQLSSLVISETPADLGIKGMNIRIFNDCEVRTENSVMRVTVRHHEACRFFFFHTLS